MSAKQSLYYTIVTAAVLTILEIPIVIFTGSWWLLALPTIGCIIGRAIAKTGGRIRQ